MKKNSKKQYVQASNYYEDGQIDKAIKKCEEIIAEDIKNASALNLKGLLLYLKGDLKAAIATWKINSDFNNDDIAKNYIKDSNSDFERQKLYKEAEVLIAKMRISEALAKLKRCKESDFNAVKVNLALAICYTKKGEFELASNYLSKTLIIDKNNIQAKKLAKEIHNYSDTNLEGLNNSKNSAFVILKVGIAVLIVGVLVVGIFKYYLPNHNFKNAKVENDQVENINESQNGDVEEEKNDDTENENKKDETTNNKNIVDVNSIQNAIDSSDYNSIYDQLEKVNIESLSGKELAVCSLAKESLQKEGVPTFYNNAMELYQNQQYNKALSELEKAYKYSSDTYLASEILYFDAAVNDKVKNNSRAIALYEEYYKKYSNGNYIEETLYNLARLYKSEDLSKAKSYAQQLVTKYPDSMYNNENIKHLLE